MSATLLAAPLFAREPAELDGLLAAAVRASEHGASLIEWRIDALRPVTDDIEFMKQLVARTRQPSILTCRPISQGGLFDGMESERLALFAAALSTELPPRFVDIELDAWLNDARWREMLHDHDNGPSLILSAHDFETRPHDLLQQIEQMVNEPRCRIIKLAWMARSVRDNVEALELIRERAKPMIAICMGEFGLMSRVLAPKAGGFLTFAAADRDSESAPGQPTLNEIMQKYRFDSIDAETPVYGVIGWPVSHSLGPLIHNAAFERAGLAGVYLPLPVPVEYEHLKATLSVLIDDPHLNFRGASVTIPHKENVLRFVRERGGRVDRHAELAEAANTLLISSSGGSIVCRNTDVPAIVDSTCDALNIDPIDLSNVHVAVLGAGGVARAAIAGLGMYGSRIAVVNRSASRATRLVERMRARAVELQLPGILDIRTAGKSALQDEMFDLIINCTPIGMRSGPEPEASALDVLSGGKYRLTDAMTVFDTVYTPSRTPLVEEAELRGARVILGIELFLRQAALQFESWSGERAPEDLWHDLLRPRG